MRYRLALLTLIVFAPLSGPAAAQHAFAPGQVWSYEGAPGTSQVIVGATETLKDDGEVVHIVITDVPFEALVDMGDADPVFDVMHVAIARADLDASVTEQTGTAPLPGNFEDALRMWRDAYTLGSTGIFEQTVSEIVADIRAGPEDAAE